MVPFNACLWSIGRPSGIAGVGGQLQLGSGQVFVTGNGGGISRRVRCRLARHCVVERGLVNLVLMLWWCCPRKSRTSDSAMAVGRALIDSSGCAVYFELELSEGVLE